MRSATPIPDAGAPDLGSADAHGTTLSDVELFALVRRGNRQAFRALFRAHQRTVYWAAFSVVRSRPDAEEVLQDAFLTLWNKRAGIHLVGESLVPWLVTTARYLALNRRRSEVRRPRDSLHRDEPDRNRRAGPAGLPTAGWRSLRLPRSAGRRERRRPGCVLRHRWPPASAHAVTGLPRHIQHNPAQPEQPEQPLPTCRTENTMSPDGSLDPAFSLPGIDLAPTVQIDLTAWLAGSTAA